MLLLLLLETWSLVIHKIQVNGYFENKDQINIHCSWQHIEVLWSETISLCKKLNIIYKITSLPVIHTLRQRGNIWDSLFQWAGSNNQMASLFT